LQSFAALTAALLEQLTDLAALITHFRTDEWVAPKYPSSVDRSRWWP
jgi:hypothetical protein